jgi:hypothetical protein
MHWKKYQSDIIEQLKACGEDQVIAGDGRHDSMGHSAKYCSYTVYSTNKALMIDFSLVQVNKYQNVNIVRFKQIKVLKKFFSVGATLISI